MDFSQYKHRLPEYLRLKNIDIDRGGNFSCINPRHGDSKPSCNVYEEKGVLKFHCFGCGCGGDIYDAVEILEGITDKAEQYKFLESTFGGNYKPLPMQKIYIAKKQKYQHIPAKYDTLEEYMRKNPMREKMVRDFLSVRATTASHGEYSTYPEDVTKNLVNFFSYFPGEDIARQEVGAELLDACHLIHPDKKYFIWKHSGLVLRLGTGFKLNYYNNGECVKIGSLGCSAFPMPFDIPDNAERVILVEGELDAVMCAAAGIKDVYSIGGTNGMTAPKFQLYLMNVKEVVLMLDNDDAGLKTMGLKPCDASDKRKTPLPDVIRKAGYTGKIKIAKLHTYKDPDDCILFRHKEIIVDAIKNAVEYDSIKKEPPKEEKKDDKKSEEKIETGRLAIKDVVSMLKRLPLANLDKADIAPFVSATIHAVPNEPDSIQNVINILRGWGAAESILKKPGNEPASFLLGLAHKYNLSYYYIHKIELATIKKSDLENLTGGFGLPIVELNFDEIVKDKSFSNFVYKRGEKSAANIIAKVLKDRIIYVETTKFFYFYNGHVWTHTADIHGIIYNILSALIKHAIKKLSPDDNDSAKLKNFKTTLFKLESYNFTNNIVKLLRVMPAVYREEITFDGTQIQETLTLQDGVIDFSGEKVIFRGSKPDEYRHDMLPYTIDEVRKNAKPEKFLAFLDSYFKDKETLKTLIYFLSTIGSRRAQFKIGGIFIGATGTGKTTLMKFIGEVYQGMIAVLPPSLIISDGRKFRNDDAPSPFMARLEGVGCAMRDETERNSQLRSQAWKELTGGGKLTARGMYAQPRDFMPTAQIIIMSNYPPRFDGNDQATIDRMVAINFRVQHKKEEKGAKTENELREELSPEYPLMIKYFAERYIELKHVYNSVVPLSDECKAFRQSYVEDQKTDLSKFFDLYVEVNIAGDANYKMPTHELFRYFCKYAGIELDKNDKPTAGSKWTLTSFSKAILSDYVGVHTKQIKVNGYPVQFYTGLKIKDGVNIGELAPKQQELIPAETQQKTEEKYNGDSYDDMPEDDPF